MLPSSVVRPPSVMDSLLAAVDDAVVVLDDETRIVALNVAAERLLGLPAGEAVDRPLGELVDLEAIGPGTPVDARAVRAELYARRQWRGRLSVRPLAGSHREHTMVLDASATIVEGPDGHRRRGTRSNSDARQIIAILRDVTAAARLEEELTGLSMLGVVSGGSRTRGMIAQDAVERVCRATEARMGIILTATPGGYVIEAGHGLTPEFSELVRSLAIPDSPVLKALQPVGTVVSTDLARAPLRPVVAEALRKRGIERIRLVGLRVHGELAGFIGLAWPADIRAAITDGVLIQAAAHISNALENARLLDELTRAVSDERSLSDQLAALQSLTSAGETASDLDGLARQTLEQVVAALGARGGGYALLSTSDRLPMVASIGSFEPFPGWRADGPAGQFDPVIHFRKGGNSFLRAYDDDFEPASEAVLARKPKRGGDKSGAAESAPAGGDRAGGSAEAPTGLVAYAALPLRTGDQLAGVLLVSFDRPIERLGVDPRALDAIARIASISLANFRLRERLVASEERYRTLFEESPEPLLLIGRRRQILDANGAALAQFRTTREELLRRRADELSMPGPNAGPRRSNAARRGRHTRFRATGVRPDGTTFPAEVTITRVAIAGEPRGLVLVRDLTTVERLQAELLQAQKMEAMGQLVSGVAHELNNPLAAVIGYSQWISRDKRLPEDMRKDAHLLAQEAERTRGIVQNLLDFARQRPPERHPTPIRPLVESVLSLQSYAIAAGQIEVSLSIPGELPPVEVDRAQMQQVLLNLTLNAIQAVTATGAPGRMDITASRFEADDGRDMVRLEIRDSGPGVPAALRSRLFVPFFSTKEPGTGTGLGLSVSFGIVAGHQGRLWFETPADGGAAFVVELPLTAVPLASQAGFVQHLVGTPQPVRTPGRGLVERTQPNERDGEHAASPSRRPRILVLDDEPAIRAFLHKALQVAGLDPVVTGGGRDAVDRVRTETFDLVMCDHRMAGMSGTEVHDAIAAIRPGLARRFVFMSGDVLNSELSDFATEHGIGLLAKPFDIETVTRTVRELLARADAEEADAQRSRG